MLRKLSVWAGMIFISLALGSGAQAQTFTYITDTNWAVEVSDDAPPAVYAYSPATDTTYQVELEDNGGGFYTAFIPATDRLADVETATNSAVTYAADINGGEWQYYDGDTGEESPLFDPYTWAEILATGDPDVVALLGYDLPIAFIVFP
jgi:hypothetical protein